MDDVQAELERGLALHRAGKLADAEAVYRAVLAEDSGNADAQHFLGLIAFAQGRADEAEASIRAAIAADEARATFHANLGAVLTAEGRLAGAAEAYGRATALDPQSAAGFRSLGAVLGRLGRVAEAEAAFRAALALEPGDADGLAGLAAALHRQDRDDEAEAACREALAGAPGHADALTNLGNALEALGRLGEAEEAQRAAVAARPDYATAHYNLGNLLARLWRQADAMAEYRAALELDPGDPAAIGNYLLASLYDPAASEESLADDHRALTARLASPAPPGPRDPDSERRLRVGYLSADFRTHSCAYFIEPLLRAHDRDAVEAIALSNVAREDETTARLKALADGWLDISGLDDEAAARAIADAGIDILIDLAGFTGGNRARLVAGGAAPVQVAWLGYPATQGMAAVGYRLTDAVADPPGAADEHHCEELIRLDPCFLCYGPPADAPEIAALPAEAAGRVTFGSFNNLRKVTPEVIETWAGIVRGTPGSRLVLKGRLLNHEESRAAITAAFESAGLARESLELRPWIPRHETPLAAYAEIDVALDTFPYNGTTTTCEALWMGVPVVTLAGTRHAARVGASLLSAAGLGDLVCGDRAAYAARAVALAGDVAALAERRRGLRARVAASPLRDETGFARNIEAAYRKLWRKTCA